MIVLAVVVGASTLVVGIAIDALLVRPLLVPCGHWLMKRGNEPSRNDILIPNAEEGTTELRKSTMTTATPLAAISLPQPRYIPS